MNTNNAGNTLRDHVLTILKSRFPDAHVEGKVAWKNADIVFTMMELGKRIKVAVECKNYNRPLIASDFSKILADYQLGLDNQDINLLLIISKRQVESASRQYVQNHRHLRYMTLAELECWLVGLEPYVQALAEEFSSDEIHEYYVEGRFEGFEGTAFDNVRSWINSSEIDDTGMAVLGGYGLGKSSLAKRLASEQALQYLKDPESERLPVLLPLGQVVHETELAGLFGKHFTSRYSLENYSYKALLQLNIAGRLLIILDGFDEMKHAMTEHDFRANFREFNKLRVRGAKVLLLGRPNAFTSESSNLLIRGLSKLGDQLFVNSDFPAWQERKLSFFNPGEQRLFLNGFLKFKSNAMVNEDIRRKRIAEIMRDIDDDILQRPVQTRIVGLLAADPEYIFKGTSRYNLYKDFVEQVVHRDQEKRARSLISAEDRHEFLRRLAWWSWTKPGVQGTFLREDVPNSLFDKLSDGQAIDNQSKRTEYLVSSLTEEKDSNFLYFAHRSFHEFLVASYITSLTHLSPETIRDLSAAMNENVIEFLQESKEESYLHLIYSTLDNQASLSISSQLIELLSTAYSLQVYIYKKSPSKITPLDIFILWRSAQIQKSENQFLSLLSKFIVSGSNDSADVACFIFLEIIYGDSEELPQRAAELAAHCWARILSGLSENGAQIDEGEAFYKGSNPLIIKHGKFGAIGEMLRKQSRKMRLLRGDWLLINAKEAYQILIRSMKALGFIGLSSPKGIKLFEIPCQLIEANMSETNARMFRSIYECEGDEFQLVRGRYRKQRTKPRAE